MNDITVDSMENISMDMDMDNNNINVNNISKSEEIVHALRNVLQMAKFHFVGYNICKLTEALLISMVNNKQIIVLQTFNASYTEHNQSALYQYRMRIPSE